MKVSAEESDLIRIGGSKQIPLWRFAAPAACEIGQCYRTKSTFYTVRSVQTYSRAGCMKAFGRKIYEEVSTDWPVDALKVWRIVVELGDHTDRPRYLLAGSPGAQVCPVCGRGFRDGAETCSRGHRRPPSTVEDTGYTHVASRGLRGEKAAVSDAVLKSWAPKAEEERRRKRAERKKQRLVRKRTYRP